MMNTLFVVVYSLLLFIPPSIFLHLGELISSHEKCAVLVGKCLITIIVCLLSVVCRWLHFILSGGWEGGKLSIIYKLYDRF